MYQTDYGEFGQGAQGILPESVSLVRFFSFLIPCVLISVHALRICWVMGESAQMISTLRVLAWSLCRDIACLDQCKCPMCTLEMGHSRTFLCTVVRCVLFLPSFTMPGVFFSANIWWVCWLWDWRCKRIRRFFDDNPFDYVGSRQEKYCNQRQIAVEENIITLITIFSIRDRISTRVWMPHLAIFRHARHKSLCLCLYPMNLSVFLCVSQTDVGLCGKSDKYLSVYAEEWYHCESVYVHLQQSI